MGLDAEIVVIGPYALLAEIDVLDYKKDTYSTCKEDTFIICTVAQASTSRQSELLAELCYVDIWDFTSHQIKKVQWPWSTDMELEFIGDDQLGKIFETLRFLLEDDLCLLFYRPNG